MTKKETYLLPQMYYMNVSHFSSDQSQSFGPSYAVSLSASIIVAALSPTAAIGNALVLAAIWRNPSLRTPSNILIAGLAFTDFCTGLISQPIYVANELIHLEDTAFKILDNSRHLNIEMKAVTSSCAVFFSSTSVLMMTQMSIERWLHMTRRSLVTVRRVLIIVAVMLLFPIPLAVYRVLFVTTGTHIRTLDIYFVSILLWCILVTSVAYLKVFRIIRRHQQQIQANELSHNFGQSSIDFSKHKKSVYTILYILIVFYIGYLPMFITLTVNVSSKKRSTLNMQMLNMTIVLAFLSSSLNPFLYVWRMKDIWNEVTHLVKRIFCF